MQQQGKGLAMVAMVNMAPCRVLAVPSSPSSPLSVPLLSTIPPHASLTPRYPISLLSVHHHIYCFFLSQIVPLSSLISLSLPPLFLPSPIFPSRHSGLPTGSRQALNAAQNKATFNASWQADWAAQQRDTASYHSHDPQNHSIHT